MPAGSGGRKDRLFNFLFNSEEHGGWTPGLYNAVNGSDYDDPSQVRLTTIREVMYLGIHNDVLFLVAGETSFYERRSSFNPNKPPRMPCYLGNHTSGTGRAQAQQVQLLAGPPAHAEVRGALQRCREPTRRRGAPALRRAPGGAEADVEVRVRAVNVNWGDSVELLGACGPLREYAWLVEEVRLRSTVEPDADFELVVDCAFAAMPKIRDKAVPDGAAGGYEAGCPKTPPMHAPPPPFAETAICIPRSLRKRPSCLIFPARKTRGRTGGPPTCANEGCLIAHTGKRASDFKHKGRFRSERGV